MNSTATLMKNLIGHLQTGTGPTNSRNQKKGSSTKESSTPNVRYATKRSQQLSRVNAALSNGNKIINNSAEDKKSVKKQGNNKRLANSSLPRKGLSSTPTKPLVLKRNHESKELLHVLNQQKEMLEAVQKEIAVIKTGVESRTPSAKDATPLKNVCQGNQEVLLPNVIDDISAEMTGANKLEIIQALCPCTSTGSGDKCCGSCCEHVQHTCLQRSECFSKEDSRNSAKREHPAEHMCDRSSVTEKVGCQNYNGCTEITSPLCHSIIIPNYSRESHPRGDGDHEIAACRAKHRHFSHSFHVSQHCGKSKTPISNWSVRMPVGSIASRSCQQLSSRSYTRSESNGVEEKVRGRDVSYTEKVAEEISNSKLPIRNSDKEANSDAVFKRPVCTPVIHRAPRSIVSSSSYDISIQNSAPAAHHSKERPGTSDKEECISQVIPSDHKESLLSNKMLTPASVLSQNQSRSLVKDDVRNVTHNVVLQKPSGDTWNAYENFSPVKNSCKHDHLHPESGSTHHGTYFEEHFGENNDSCTPAELQFKKDLMTIDKVKKSLLFDGTQKSSTYSKEFLECSPVSHVCKFSKPISSSLQDVSQQDKEMSTERTEPIEKCLGCYPFARFPFFVLNSRNCVPALRKDKHTCEFHRVMIERNQDWIQKCRKNMNHEQFESHEEEELESDRKPHTQNFSSISSQKKSSRNSYQSRSAVSSVHNISSGSRKGQEYDDCSSVYSSVS